MRTRMPPAGPPPVLTLAGSPRAIGRAHGAALAEAIRHFAAERVSLAGDPLWSGRTMSRAAVLAVAEACVPAHRAYAPDLFAELEGMAEATGLSVSELIVAGGFTDFTDTLFNLEAGDADRRPSALVGGQTSARSAEPPHTPPRAVTPRPIDDCTACLVPTGATDDGAALYAQTWDMHATAAEHVVLLELVPDDGHRALVFTSAGCLGMIGLNAAGVVVGINNLAGADGRIGVTWPFVVRRALQESSASAALRCITEAPLAGAHNYLVLDAAGDGYNVEAFPTACHVTPLTSSPLVHTNHCLAPSTRSVMQIRPSDLQAASEARLSRADELLAARPVTVASLIALTRDPDAICVRPKPPKDVATCGAVIARPATGEMWAIRGLPSEGEYGRYVVSSR